MRYTVRARIAVAAQRDKFELQCFQSAEVIHMLGKYRGKRLLNELLKAAIADSEEETPFSPFWEAYRSLEDILGAGRDARRRGKSCRKN